MKLIRILVLGSLLCGGVAGMCPASEAGTTGQGQCRQEIHQLCAAAGKGPARKECIQKNLDKFSPTCQERIRARWEKQRQKNPEPETGSAPE
jgi:hypothetical protein